MGHGVTAVATHGVNEKPRAVSTVALKKITFFFILWYISSNTWNPLCLAGTSLMWLRHCLALNPLYLPSRCYGDLLCLQLEMRTLQKTRIFTLWAKLERNRPEWKKSAFFHILMVCGSCDGWRSSRWLLHLNSLIPAGRTKLPLDLHIKCFLVCLWERPALTQCSPSPRAAGGNQRPRSAQSPRYKTLKP